MDSEEPSNLRSLFSKSLSLASSATPSNPASIQTALASFERCKTLAENFDLFSLNESIEDVSTSDLPYLSIDYHIAELVAQEHSGQPNERIQVLKRARKAYMSLLNLCDSYDQLSKQQRELYEQLRTTTDASTAGGGNSDTRTFESQHTDAGSRRNAKIEKYKEEKEMKSKIAQLTATQATADDETLRSLRLAQLSLNIHDTFSSLESLALEFDLLLRAPPAEQLERQMQQGQSARDNRMNSSTKDSYTDKLDPSAVLHNAAGRPLLDSGGRPMQPFTLLDNRAMLKGQVFGSGHRLPTMTIDEYLAEERKRGGIIDGGGQTDGNGGKGGREGQIGGKERVEIDEDNMDILDAETMKSREWDEFTEANPKGSGNTMNRG